MALQSSGPISLANLAGEFGGSQPYSLSQFYRGGGRVPDSAGNAAIATSGAIALGQFYNAANRVSIPITISTNQANYVLNTAKAAGYVAGTSDIVLTINSGVYVSANATNVYALEVDTSWAAGDTVTIVNNGFIVGRGGNGGAGAAASNGVQNNGAAGSSAGPALRALRQISVNNLGTIGGGGGGGGGGGSQFASVMTGPYSSDTYAEGGGGGGGGRSGSTSSSGAAGGTASGCTFNFAGGVGGSGTTSSAGTGGTRGGTGGGVGGAGGGWGATGSAGGTSGSGRTGGAGGSGGAAVAGNANITWISTGTRLGTIA